MAIKCITAQDYADILGFRFWGFSTQQIASKYGITTSGLYYVTGRAEHSGIAAFDIQTSRAMLSAEQQ